MQLESLTSKSDIKHILKRYFETSELKSAVEELEVSSLPILDSTPFPMYKLKQALTPNNLLMFHLVLPLECVDRHYPHTASEPRGKVKHKQRMQALLKLFELLLDRSVLAKDYYYQNIKHCLDCAYQYSKRKISPITLTAIMETVAKECKSNRVKFYVNMLFKVVNHHEDLVSDSQIMDFAKDLVTGTVNEELVYRLVENLR